MAGQTLGQLGELENQLARQFQEALTLRDTKIRCLEDFCTSSEGAQRVGPKAVAAAAALPAQGHSLAAERRRPSPSRRRSPPGPAGSLVGSVASSNPQTPQEVPPVLG